MCAALAILEEDPDGPQTLDGAAADIMRAASLGV